MPTDQHPEYVTGMPTPEMVCRGGSEEAHQKAIMVWSHLPWVAREFPELEWLHHIPNGGSRGDTAKSRAIAGSDMKMAGVKRGIPDLFLPVTRGGWAGLYIELKKPALRPQKAPKPGAQPEGTSSEQWKFGRFARGQGYGWVCCYSWDEVRDVLLAYLGQPATSTFAS